MKTFRHPALAALLLGLLPTVLPVLHAQEEPPPVADDPLAPEFAPFAPTAEEGRLSNTPRRVDILMAYTPAARVYAGGANAMLAAINAHIALANTCYTNSDIPITLRAVGVVETNYTEAGDFNTDLNALTSTNDGKMDELHALRTNSGADLVALIRRNSANGVAGLAWVNPYDPGNAAFASYAFSVTADVWASGNIAFPHELGHNFGAWHDRANSSSTTHAYAYGWRFYGNDNVQYITVMAYYPGTRIPYFSNPNILYQGTPTGVASGPTAADVAMRHEVTAASTAAYRPDPASIGSRDIVWQHTDGRLVAWFQNNTTRTGTAILPVTVASGWRAVGSADLNADGKLDLIFQHTDGRVCYWYMDGVLRQSVALTSLTAAAGWTCVGVGDFNGDGRPDLLWNHTDGRLLVWYMNGATATSTDRILLTYASGWSPRLVADMDRDGKPDIVFINTDGRICVWHMNGIARRDVALFDTRAAAGWTLVASADYDADGKPDLLWFNTVTQRLVAWYMDDAARLSYAPLDSTAAAGWSVIPR